MTMIQISELITLEKLLPLIRKLSGVEREPLRKLLEEALAEVRRKRV